MTDVPTTPDPIEMAMEAEASGRPPEGIAHEVLRKQSALLGWQVASERAGFGLKVLTGLAGLALAGVLGVMLWQASRADGVRLEPFAVPPALAADGVSGEVVANQVLDELARLRAETSGFGRSRDYGDDWGRDIKVAIPATGVSLGELQAALRQWLGHETRITGEVYRTASGGLALRARVPGRPGLKVEGAPPQLESLAQALARSIYRETQPIRYAHWLADHGDPAGAADLAERVAATAIGRRARAEAHLEAAYARGLTFETEASLAQTRLALDLAPDWWRPIYMLSVNELNAGRLEPAIRGYRQALRLRRRDPGGGVSDAYIRARIAQYTDDVPEMLRQYQLAAEEPETRFTQGVTLDRNIAQGLALQHDIAGAEARLRRPQFAQPWLADLRRRTIGYGWLFTLNYAEDYAGIVARQGEILSEPPWSTNRPLWGVVGVAKAYLGDAKGAHEILDPMPEDCDPCMNYRTRAFAALGDFAGGDRAGGMVEARSPSSPNASYNRGRIRLDRRDAAGALPFFREAERRQARWADPFKSEGDALAMLGRFKEADAAYAKAYPLAPKWGGLHLQWAGALSRLGKADEARKHLRTAVGLYLTAPERAELRRVMR